MSNVMRETVTAKPVQTTTLPWWKSWGPGAIVAACIIGPGTVTTVSVAGAELGFQVAWILVIACLVGYFIQRPVINWTIATGTSVLEGIRDEVSVFWSKAIFFGLWLGALAFQAGNFIGASMAMNLLFPSIPMLAWVSLLSVMAMSIAWFGVYKVLENINRIVMVMLVLTFCLTALVALPGSGSTVSQGFTFSIPQGNILIILALVATILVPNTLVALSGFTKNKYRSSSYSKEQIRRLSFNDLKINFTLLALISVAILLSSASAFYGSGQTIASAGDMAVQLTPILGSFATIFFAVGLWTAGFSSGLFNLTVQPMLFGHAFKRSEDPSAKVNRMILIVTGMIPIALVWLFGGSPIELIISAQAINGLLLPILTVVLFILTNKKDRMGQFKNTTASNTINVLIIGLVTVLAVQVFMDFF
ncbi:Nramp family divalent metal transporter [Geomicrobium sp. JCM 19038]|uniref:Nramp family divalent metal transporter n=1 Tax=Geomicrobium sp. JCM 19038 TaxID=1460635 RepID=UPI00045F4B41|nr:Nramp family divalent metal transporter [Geomicrobium sp. JCM 19038]GAK08432.1 manganese transport protein MntH [Geomicrobium sp. JCM 19038]